MAEDELLYSLYGDLRKELDQVLAGMRQRRENEEDGGSAGGISIGDFEQLRREVAALSGLVTAPKGIDDKNLTIDRLRLELDVLNKRLKEVWPPRRNTTTTTTITAGGGVLVKASSSATGGGWYHGNYWNPPSTTPAGTSTLTESQAGVIGDAILICNLAEITKATHDIKFSGTPTPYQFIFPGTLIQPTTDGEDPFVAIYVGQWGCA